MTMAFKTPDRILVFVGENRPESKAEFEKFPPRDYPLQLSLMFSRRDAHLVSELKEILDKQPGEVSRYRTSVAKHVGNSVTLRCYFRDVDALRPVAWQLKDRNLWSEGIQYGSQEVTPRTLIEKARLLSSKEAAVSL